MRHFSLHFHKKPRHDKAVERFMMVIATVEPLTTIPQIFTLYSAQDASGLSFSTWLLYLIAAVIWLLYGIRIKSKPLIVSSVFWIITELPVVVGILIY